MATRAIIRAGRAAALTNPYARAGYLAGRYGPTAARAAWKIAKWGIRRYRMRSRKRKRASASVGKRARLKFGDRIGTSNAKKVAYNIGPTASDTRQLYVVNLIDIDRGQDLNQRERDVINFRGVRLCNSWYNNFNVPLFINCAVVSRKDADSTIPPETGDFFRDLNGNSRGQDFDPAILTSIAFRCLPINTDKYLVHKHKRYVLAGDVNTNFYQGNKPSYMNTKWYIPFKRQIRYDTVKGGDLSYNANLYFIWWCDQINATSGTTAVIGACHHQYHFVSYWRETKT